MTIAPARRTYCSDAARLRGDDHAATASRVDVWILVELAAAWGYEPIVDAALPTDVRNALRAASDAIPRSRVVFIRRRVEKVGPARVYVVRSAPIAGAVAVDVPSIGDVANLPFEELAASAQPQERPLVLVCTHGQHDSCCGRRGYPLYDALRQRPELDVWQCSHIGGDRFAANAVVLPWGLYYGPVEPSEADELTAAVLAGDIFLPGYRGRSSLPRVIQAAEIHVRRITGLTARDALELISRRSVGASDEIRLRDTGGGTHDVTIERYHVTEEAFLTCMARSASPVPQFRITRYTSA